MSEHKCVVRICLEDLTHGNYRQAGRMFDAIEQCKHAIKAKGCRVKDITFSNEPNRVDNPRGDMQSVIFDVLTPFEDVEAELVLIQRLEEDRFHAGPDKRLEVWPMAEFNLKFPKG